MLFRLVPKGLRKVIALYSVFNTQGTLVESMESVAPMVDEIHLVDGRYSEFRDPCGQNHENSCDRTASEVEAFSLSHPEVSVEYHKWPAMNENTKRTKMFDFVGDDDVGLIVDDDEIYYGPKEGAREFAMTAPAQVGWVMMLSVRAAKDYTARLFRKSKGLRYETYAVLRDDRGLVCDIHRAFETNYDGCYLVPKVRVVHLYGEGLLGSPGYRATAEREQARIAYDTMLAKRGWK